MLGIPVDRKGKLNLLSSMINFNVNAFYSLEKIHLYVEGSTNIVMIVKLIAIVNSVACVVQPVVIKITNNFLIVVKVNPRLMSSPASTASMVQLQPPLSSKLVTSIKVETLTNL